MSSTAGRLIEHHTNENKGLHALIKLTGFEPVVGFDKEAYKEYFPVEFFGLPETRTIFSGNISQIKQYPHASHAGYVKIYDGHSADTRELEKLMREHLTKEGDNTIDEVICVLKPQDDKQKEAEITFKLEKVKLAQNGSVVMFSVVEEKPGEVRVGTHTTKIPYENAQQS